MKPRILLVQPSVQPPGGGNSVAAWIIQALQHRYELSLWSLQAFDAASVNRFYGTSIDPARVHARQCYPRLTGLLDRVPVGLALLRSSLVLHALHRSRERFDLVITANNEANLGVRGVQYIHFPAYERPRPKVDLRSYHWPWLTRPYYAVCDRIAGFSPEGVRRSLTLTNSDWTGQAVAQRYGVSARTVYPPVAGSFPAVPWEAREDGFVCVGRLSPEKEHERIFAILGRVRARFPSVRLHLVCSPWDPAYSARILGRAERERAWVTVHQDMSRAELIALMSRQRYGIHGMREEHFGIAIAEMVQAGCITWVPDGGGQVEIVGRDERVLYRSDDEAVQKIEAALADPAHAEALREALALQRSRFSDTRFVSEIQHVVAEMLAGREASA